MTRGEKIFLTVVAIGVLVLIILNGKDIMDLFSNWYSDFTSEPKEN